MSGGGRVGRAPDLPHGEPSHCRKQRQLEELRVKVKTVKPGGTFYCFPDFSAYERDSQKLSRLLLDRVRVVTVPGREFGMEGHLRMSFCGTLKEITEGIERIRWALDPEAPNEMFLGDRKLVRNWR